MPLQVGVNVVEVDGRASPALQAAPTSVAAFLGRTRRGVPNRAVRVTSLDQFAARFGGHRGDAYLAYAVRGFFLNGGREAHVVARRRARQRARLHQPPRPPDHPGGLPAGDPPGTAGRPILVGGARRSGVDVRDDPKATTTVTAAAAATATSLRLASLAGIDVGTVLRVVVGHDLDPPAGHRRRPGRRHGHRRRRARRGGHRRRRAVTSAEFRLVVRVQDELDRRVQGRRGMARAIDGARLRRLRRRPCQPSADRLPLHGGRRPEHDGGAGP